MTSRGEQQPGEIVVVRIGYDPSTNSPTVVGTVTEPDGMVTLDASSGRHKRILGRDLCGVFGAEIVALSAHTSGWSYFRETCPTTGEVTREAYQEWQS